MEETKEKIEDRINKLKLYNEVLKYNTLGERLRYLRKAYKNITMAEQSKKLNIARSYCYLYENNKAIPTEIRLQEISNFYDIDINILDTKKSSNTTLNELYIIHDIETKLFNVTVDQKRKKETIQKLDLLNIYISECNTIMYLINNIPNSSNNSIISNKKELINFICMIFKPLNKNIEPTEKCIKEYLKEIITKVQNAKDDIEVDIDYLFKPIEHAIYSRYVDQKLFNDMIRKMMPIIEVLYRD